MGFIRELLAGCDGESWCREMGTPETELRAHESTGWRHRRPGDETMLLSTALLHHNTQAE